MLHQRAAGSPLQYLLGDVRWCGLDVLCRAPVLIPRPETEEMVDWLCAVIRAGGDGHYQSAESWLDVRPTFETSIAVCTPPAADDAALMPDFRVLDLCTGSGCISLALAAHLGCTTVGTDINPAALQLAADNKAHITTQLPSNRTLHSTFQHDDIRHSSLPQHTAGGRFHCVVANPPYIPTAELATLQIEVRQHESLLALDGGITGTQLYNNIAALAARVLAEPAGVGSAREGWPELVVETGGDEQCDVVMECFRAAGFVHCVGVADRAGKMRWIAGRR